MKQVKSKTKHGCRLNRRRKHHIGCRFQRE